MYECALGYDYDREITEESRYAKKVDIDQVVVDAARRHNQTTALRNRLTNT